jgi:2-phosphoglycerate kinase
LFSGASGTCKSTLCSELADRLDVVLTQSMDMMRMDIRSSIEPHVMPAPGISSFGPWRSLLGTMARDGLRKTSSPAFAGSLVESANVRLVLKATVARAMKERQDMIVEGFHVVRMDMDLSGAPEKVIIVSAMLTVTRGQQLENLISRHSRDQSGRGSSRYLEQLDARCSVQSFLPSRAD